MKDKEGYELKTYRVVWRVEIGVVDGGGIGLWVEVVESHPFPTKAEAETLKQEWLDAGKIKRMNWGGFRPTNMNYGDFRIRCGEELVVE